MVSLLKTSFSAGEIDPALWGRIDLAENHNGCSVARNCFVNIRGGISSRAGFAFVGPCKQVASAAPPRNIPFRFSVNQNYILEFGDQYMRVVANGAYVTETPFTVTNAVGGVITATGNNFSVGDTVYAQGIGGAIQYNNRFFQVAADDGVHITLNDMYGNPVTGTGYGTYSSGGQIARVFTLTSPYAAVDLPYLKYTQSADVMSLRCVNQVTGTEYPPFDLSRTSATSWTFTQTTYGSQIAAPQGLSLSATSVIPPSTTPVTQTGQYSYCVTAVNSNGDESVASNTPSVTSVDISAQQGSIIMEWLPVSGVSFYNIYKAPFSYASTVPIGSQYAYIGFSYGVSFIDSNITADQTKSPPLHTNPFAPGQILFVNITSPGGGYTQASAGATINTSTGSLGVILPVISGAGQVVAGIVQNGGQMYQPGDSVTFTGGGGGFGTLQIGPETGTFPSVVAYFQSRRVDADTLDNPDTLFFSQTGLFTNMDASNPPIDSDAIITTPWGSQVNGIQWMLPMPGGLIAGTGIDCWQLTGTGGAFSPVTPSSQSAQPQEAYGFSAIVQPKQIGWNVLYWTPYNDLREIEYNFFANIYAGRSVGFPSSHLLLGDNYTVLQNDWSQEPNRLLWSYRADGKFLSFTYLKEQKIEGWCRHDTNGQVVSLATITELPVDAVYMIMKRFIPGENVYMYFQERMNNRIWDTAEDVWAVDAGLSLGQPAPNATLTASSADGPMSILSGFVTLPGSGYTDPAVQIIDPYGTGSGAEVSLTLSGGQITGVVVVDPGQDYGAYRVIITDSTGRGGQIGLVINRNVTFEASASVFASTDVGSVIRMGGGQAVVTSFASATQVTGSMKLPIVLTAPNDPNVLPLPAQAGQWTLTKPIQTLTNLDHLNGFEVSCVADGSVVSPTMDGAGQPVYTLTVENGSVTLPTPASQIVIGLPFTVQVQTLHADIPGGQTIQGKRKRINGMSVRLDHSRGIQLGANQPTAATAPFQAEIPWTRMQEIKDRNTLTTKAGAMIPLFTGDRFIPIDDDWNLSDYQASPGMAAAQQVYPLPMNIIQLVPDIDVGDVP